MLDIKFVRENKELIENAVRNRQGEMSLSALVDEETKKRELIREVEELRNRRNTVSEEVGGLKKENKDASELIHEMKMVSEKIKTIDDALKEIDREIVSLC